LSGKAVCWTTQNLGADQQATALTDATEASAGWYWQFNRIQGFKHDGTTRTPATSWISAISETSDWLLGNDPCNRLLGTGWRLPTSLEYSNVITNGGVPFSSPLKLHNSGYLVWNSGVLTGRGTQGNYWNSTMGSTTNAYELYNVGVALVNDNKAYGFTVRCLRDTLVLSGSSVSDVTFSNMTSTSADVSAAVTPDGGSPVTERGFCWNTTGVPTTTDNVVRSGLGLGTFTGTVTGGLVQGPTYYVRAYAINKIGISYSTVNSFRICPAAFTVQHIAGIDGAPVSKTVTYHSVSSTLSGKAVCWITQNLGADQQPTSVTDATEVSAGWYWQFNRIQGFKHDGTTRTPALSWIAIDETSDWLSANDPCTRLLGSDWRIPTSLEYSNVITNGGVPYSSPLKLHNSGYLVWNSGVLTGRGTQGNYWNSTMGSTTNAYELYNVGSSLVNDNKAYGFTVRCLRDAIVISPPSVGQVAVDASSMTGTSAGVSAAVGSDGGASVNARGFCWNLTGNPTLSDNHITDAAVGTGNFAGTITGLTYGPKYYIRAYATNIAGTAYSEGTGFNAVLTDICPDTFNIQHTVGFRGAPVTKTVTYHAVQTSLSGATHCWITQNLGADHPATSAADATDASGGWFFQFNRSLGYAQVGTTHTPVAFAFSISENSDWTLINDPCNIMLGTDWRLPTATEWTNVDGAPQNWTTYTDAYNSVLKLHDAGYIMYNTGVMGGRGTQGNYWSSTGSATTNAYDLQFYGSVSALSNNAKTHGFSVRCLRDALAKVPPTLGAVVVPTATMTDSTAQGTATILQNGGLAITERGLCWNTTGIPTITDHKVIYSASDMTYTSLMTGLTAGVTYYVRAYAMNKIGIGYSSTVTSLKKCNPVNTIHVAGFNGAPVSKSVTYGTVATNISGKLMCWTTQNLGADQQATSVGDATEPSGGWYWQFNRAQGFQYTTSYYPTTWTAVNESSDWVPANDPCNLLLGSGWRIPTYVEWANAVGAPQNWANSTNTYNSVLKLHAAGFLSNGSMVSRGVTGEFWTSTQTSAINGGNLGFNTTVCYMQNNVKSTYGFSLRCIRDSVLVSKPSVSDVTITGKSKTTVTVTAVAVDNGAPVTARGFYWNTTGNPTTADQVLSEDNNIGAFTDSITGLAEGVTYYIRAYATNRIGIAYSSTVTQFKVCPPVFTVQHVAGFNGAPVSKTITYNSVSSTLSGKAVCWITQNLGADTIANGLLDTSLKSAGWYWQFNRLQAYAYDGKNRIPGIVWPSVSENSDWISGNDPCKKLLGGGWRIPTMSEWQNVVTNGNFAAAATAPYTSVLKLHSEGIFKDGTFAERGLNGNYWSSKQGNNTGGYGMYFLGSGGSALQVISKSSYGFGLRCLRDTIVISAPSVSDVVFFNMTSTSADVSAAVTPDGGSPVTERGFCWNTTGDPSISDSKLTSGVVVGSFTSTISGLVQGPTYYVKAYAINKIGIAYGPVNSFKICPDTFSITHIVGFNGAPVNKKVRYHSVSSTLSGKAVCWITQNLGADTIANGLLDTSLKSAGWYWQFNRLQAYAYDGTNRIPGIVWPSVSENSDWVSDNDPCNKLLGGGWRIPTMSEWQNVVTNGNFAAAATAPYASVLKLHSEGIFKDGIFAERGLNGNYWSSKQGNNTGGYGMYFLGSGGSALQVISKSSYGFGLRCLRDTIIISTPSVSDVTFKAMTKTYADISASVTPDGGAAVTDRGFCWNTTGNPTVSDHPISMSSGLGAFNTTLTGLTEGSTYYVRAYAINKIGISYSTVNSFKICPAVFTVQHIEGIDGAPVSKTVMYHSVSSTISGKAVCWITQNLGADSIATAATDATEKSAGWYWQFNRVQGFQYTTVRYPSPWVSAINENSNWVPANDPCVLLLGTGWRIPINSEWTAAKGTPQNWANYNDTYNSILKLHGAGYLNGSASTIVRRGSEGDYWSATQYSGTDAYYTGFNSSNFWMTGADANSKSKYAFSLRCLRDTVVINAPTVRNVTVSDITSSSAGVSAIITPDGGSPVTERGFCWNTTGNPTVANNKIIDGSAGTGAFSATLSGLAASTTYYLCAYATNNIGTAYSPVVKSFMTNPPLTVSSITPPMGPTAGGTNVTITGTNFILPNSGGDAGWATVSGMTLPATLYGSQQAVIGAKIYLFGGYNGSAYVNTIYSAPVSDPTTWSNTGKTLPGNLYGSQLAVVGSNLYLFGGHNGAVTNVIYTASVSDPTTWAVVSGKTLPGNLHHSQLAIVNNNLYLFGGLNGTATSVIYTASVSDPTTWSNTGKTLPGNLYGSQVAKVGSNLYLFGGHNGISASNVIYTALVSDPTTWTNIGKTLPANDAHAQLINIGDYLYLLGGNNGSANVSSIFTASITDPTTWTTSTSTLPAALHVSSVAVIDDYAYLFGGYTTAVTSAIYRAPLTHNRPNAYNKPWLTNWKTIATDQSNVTIGGNQAAYINFASSTSITADTPGHPVGAADVVVTNYDGQSATLTNGFTYLPPTISSISPDNGSTLGGTTVTITGANFVGSFGTGSDGPITINANKDINTDVITTGRTCADAVNYSVTALTANTATLSTAPAAGCLAAGDEILLINQQGTNTNYANVGNYETLRIQSISSNVVTFTTNKTKYYGNNTTDDTNIGIATTNQRVMLQRVPNYTDVTINFGTTLTADAWDGTKGGVIYFRASGVVTNNGTISMNGKGYRGGSGWNGEGSGRRGESCPGYPNDQSYVGYYGAGGGGRYWVSSGDAGDAGGGGSYGSAGLAGGGSGGGYTGSVYGIQDISTAYLGSGGGGGAGDTDGDVGNGGNGGSGGGLILLAAGKFLNGGSISSYGNNGANAYDPGDGEPGSGGGGAGGSILFNVTNSSFGSNLVLAKGGAGGVVSAQGGAGGAGRIAMLYRNRISGASVPAAYSQQIPGGTTIRVSFGGTVVFGTVVNSTTIVVNAPAHTAGAADVTVTNCDGQSATFTNGYTYVAPPTVNSITPATSLRTGGGTVTISGSAFFGTPAVKIGGTDATSVSRINANTLSVFVPAHIVGTFDVLVTNPDLQSATLANAFTFAELLPTVSSISPNTGSAAGGTNVTITGTNFILPNSGGDAGWATVSGKTLPVTLYASQLAVVGDKIYLFGGHNGSTFVNAIYSAPVSDPTIWSNTGTILPGNFCWSNLIRVADKLYLFGGNNGASMNTIYSASVSDPTTWINTGKTLPVATHASHIFTIGDYVYLFGGCSTSLLSSIYRAPVSDPTNWTNTGKTLPSGSYAGTISVIGDHVYIFSGNTGSYTNIIYSAPVSDPTTWTNTGKTLPGVLGLSQIITVGNYNYLLGGYTGSAGISAIYKSPVSDPTTWTIASGALPAVLYGSQVAVIDGFVYLFGGYTTATTSAIYRAPLTHNRPNVYNKSWMTNWRTIATDQSNVTIGGNQATNINFVSSTSITAATPAHTVGATDVVVTNHDGQSATFTNGYTYW